MLLKTHHATASDKLKSDTNYALQQTMLTIASDTPLLLSVVAGGPTNWRNVFLRNCRGLAVNEAVADSVFAFFCTQVEYRFGRGVTAGQVLDTLEVPSPLSQKEIDDAWEVESFSSEEGRRYFYGPDGHPEELVRRMVVH